MNSSMRDTEVIFVFGALRSGTTLFRLMLNSHPEVKNPGEADFLFDFLTPDIGHPTGWRYDKQAMMAHRIFRAHGLVCPAELDGLDLLEDLLRQFQADGEGQLTLNIHRHAERAASLLPRAKFVHLIRDPRDVARSSIGMGWAGTSYHGVGHWIETESEWDLAAAKIHVDSVLSLKFETLMSDLETELIRVCDFLGVPFEERMLEYYRNSSYGPPDPKIAHQWKNKATAHEIGLIEGRCHELMLDRGYDLNGAPITPRAFEKFTLEQTNHLKRWRHNIRRFGLPLFIGAHAARLVGPKSIHEYFQKRLEAKVIENLK